MLSDPATGSPVGPAQDSLPALHTLHDDDIASVASSFEEHALTVTMKNGVVYRYLWKDWDTEDANSDTAERIKKAIHSLSMTFTKAEHMPEFPGGDDAWQKYMIAFCEAHKKDIRKAGSGQIMVQFVVHLKGQLTDILTIGHTENAKQAALAIQAVRESQPWTPALQRGHQVVCYGKTMVILQ